MTITLHWWLIPLVIAISGCFFMRSEGMFDFTPLIGVALFFIAGAVCLGHWL